MVILSAALIGLSTLTFIAGLFVLPAIVVRIPFDYFVRERPPRLPFERHHPALRLALLGLKNLAGLALIIAGVVMVVTPGPGIIAILAGISLVDLPGKRALERRLIGLPRVLGVINRLRTRRGRPPLLPPIRGQFA